MGGNPGTDAAGITAQSSARLQEALSHLALPAITQALDAYTSDLGKPGEEPVSVRKAFGDTRTQLNNDYATSKESSAAYLKQQFKQSGSVGGDNFLNYEQQKVGRGIDQNQAQANRALNFQESQAGLNQTNSLISNINGVGGNLLSGSLKFGQNALGADQLLSQVSQQNQQQAATYGALAGAAVGTVIYPGIGTALGGAIGGAVGGGFFG